MKNRIIVIYDSIHNPVFQSQVVQPLIRWLDHNPHARGTIISLERKSMPLKEQQSLIFHDPRIKIIILHKLPFFGSVSLRYAARQLKKVFSKPLDAHTTITARGPLAGRIVALVDCTRIPVIVQARGLAAQEYRYAHRSWLTAWFHRIRAYQYERVEQWVYGTYARNRNVSIQTVSHALRQYLIKTFDAPQNITVAHHDIPPAITDEQRLTWQRTMRTELCIPKDAYVYAYNGSAKPWQCPHETIQFFIKQYDNNPKSFLLILTQDVSTFKTLLTQYRIPHHAFHIQAVPHTQIYQYLAAANAGMLLREDHIINWVSRPTKALEYQVVGLKIIHNNTVGMLATTQ